jgi:hypothetical protein
MHLLTFWPLSLFYFYVDIMHPSLLSKYKVQPTQHATVQDYRRCAKQVLFNQFFVAGPGIWVMFID